MKPRAVAVTGASGWIGRVVCAEGARRGFAMRALTRSQADLGPDTQWSPWLDGVDTLIHCAARVHVMDRAGQADEAGFHRVNALGTACLAKAAAAAGVRRMIFLSSIKVNGELASAERPFRADDTPAPADAYARSKAAAEAALWEVAAQSDLEGVVIRPPLVHGPGVGGNLASLLNAVARGWPLPLGAVNNQRSLIGRANLVDGLLHCINAPTAPGRVWLMRDAHMPSTPELITEIAAAMNKKNLLIKVPVPIIRGIGQISGQKSRVERLIRSLCMDVGDTEGVLGWRPPLTFKAGIEQMVKGDG